MYYHTGSEMVLKTINLGLTLSDGTQVFKGISLECEQGELCLLTGKSGSGKTLFGYTLSGLLPLTVSKPVIKGTIEFLGEPIVQGDHNPEIGVILENPYTQLSGIKRTVRDELAFPLECRGIDPEEMSMRIIHVSERLGIDHLLYRKIWTLSGGELQRALIACALIPRPRFLFLDRPLTEIDPGFRPEIMNTIETHNKETRGAAFIAEDSWLLPKINFSQTISFGEVDISPLPNHDLKYLKAGLKPEPDGKMFRAENISFSYEKDKPLINDLSFGIDSGEIAFITGPNGAGKSTLAGIIAGTHRPYSGKIFLETNEITDMELAVRAEHVGLLSQNPTLLFCRGTVREEFELSEKWGNPAWELVDILGLEQHMERHPLELTQAEQKRLGTALASGGNRRLIILDEPTQYQDQEGFSYIEQMLRKLSDKGRSFLIITHDPRLSTAFRDVPVIHLSQEDNV